MFDQLMPVRTAVATKTSTDVGVSTAASIAVGLGSLAMVGGLMVATLGIGLQKVAAMSVEQPAKVQIATVTPTGGLQFVGKLPFTQIEDMGVMRLSVAGTKLFASGHTGPDSPHVIAVFNTTPPIPEYLGMSTLGDIIPGKIEIQNQKAYLSYFTILDSGGIVGGLRVLDASTTNLAEISFYETGILPSSIVVRGSYAYISGLRELGHGATMGLLVLDVSTPTPQLVGKITTTGYNSLAIRGNYLYALNYETRVVDVIDITNPANPTVVASVNILNTVTDSAHVDGDYLYISATAQAGPMLGIFDLTAGSNPRSVSTLQLPYATNGCPFTTVIAIKNTALVGYNAHCFAALNYPRIYAVDISQKNAPRHVDTFVTNRLTVEFREPVFKDGYFYVLEIDWTGTSPDVAHVFRADLLETVAPIISLTAPAANATVSGNAVNIAANASDNVGVTDVKFFVDGAQVGTDTSSAYAVSWNSTGATTGTHTIVARARDAAGNRATSTPVTVTVNNNKAPRIGFTRTDFSLKQVVSHRLWLNFTQGQGKIINAQPVPGYSACHSMNITTSPEPTCASGVYPQGSTNDCRYYFQLSNWSWSSATNKQVARCVIKIDYDERGVTKSKYFESFITKPGTGGPGQGNQEYVCETNAPTAAGRTCIAH